jgi:hypothetical protein
VWTVRISQETRYVTVTETNLLMLLGNQSLFTVRTIRNTQIHCVSRMRGFSVLNEVGGEAVAQTVEALCYSTTRKVAASRPDVIEFFHLPNPSTQPLA